MTTQFSVLINNSAQFGNDPFNGESRWLELAVRCPAGSGSFTLMTPRQSIAPTPYAIFSQSTSWFGIVDMPEDFADGVDNTNTYTAGTGLALNGNTFSVQNVPWTTLSGVPVGFADGVDNTNTYTAGTGLALKA
jgi:hypothetical protein